MKRSLYASLFALAAVALCPAASRAASAEKVHEYVEVMGMKKMMTDMIPIMIPAITNNMTNVMRQAHPDMPADMPEIVTKVVSDVLTSLLPQMIEAEEKVFAANLTDEEVTGAIAFYKTPVGQSLLKKLPIMTQQGMQASQAVVMSHIPDVQQRLAAELKARHPDFKQ